MRRASAVLNDIAADRDQTLPQLRQMLAPRIALENGGFLAGEAPGYADYVLFAAFHDRSRISVKQAVDDVKFRTRGHGDDTCAASGSPIDLIKKRIDQLQAAIDSQNNGT